MKMNLKESLDHSIYHYFFHALIKRITNIIREIPVFFLRLIPPLEITDSSRGAAPQIKNHRFIHTVLRFKVCGNFACIYQIKTK